MALNIKDRRTDELAREVARLSDKSLTEALRETLELRVVELRKARERKAAEAMEQIRRLQREVAAIPVRDARPIREIQDALNQDILESNGVGDLGRP